MRILVGFDGNDGGRDALELARVMASATGAGVLVVAAIPYGPLPVSAARLEGDQLGEAEPLLAEARERLGDLEVETRAFGGGSPAGVLTMVAEEEDLELLVVGSPHRGPVGRALIGSVADSLLPAAPCAVVVAPRGYATERHQPFGLIAVAYDGTAEARMALRRAERIAAATGARLRILTVVSPPTAVGVVGYVPPKPPDPEKIAEEAIDSIDRGLQAESRVLSGPTAITLASAGEDGVDLIVAGSRGHGPFMRVLLGSVSSRLVHEAPCPVLIVPRP
jgi:nucleotide-binding universal stress UspA family protein